MSYEHEMPTETEIDEFYSHFLKYGFFHGDQSRIHEKAFIKLSTFFNNAFRKRGYSGGDLEIGTTYQHNWGTVVWFFDPVHQSNDIDNIVKSYIQKMLDK
jgi:hypothetical protein